MNDSIKTVVEQVVTGRIAHDELQGYVEKMIQMGVSLAGHILVALVIFIIGKYAINFIVKAVDKFMVAREVEASLRSFMKSIVKVLLIILLGVTIVGQLGIETTSFAALLASIGLAAGMAFSGNLQNFAAGVIILLMRPFKVGDLVNIQGYIGEVVGIQIFHTLVKTVAGEVIYYPNNNLMTNPLINMTKLSYRPIELVIGVEYNEDYDKVKAVLESIIKADERILPDPEPVIVLKELADSSVNIMVRCATTREHFFLTRHDLLQRIYKRFNEEGIGFPFPQLTVHQATD